MYLKKKLAFGIVSVLAMVLLVLLAGSYDFSNAQENASFQINNSTLVAYNGTDEKVVIPDGITTIGTNAFAGNTNIHFVTIPEGVTTIEKGAFSNACNLEGITIPDSVRSISDSAFDGCTNLSSVSVGKGLNHLGNGVFSGCSSLSNVQFSTENTSFVCTGSCIYNKDMTTLYQYLSGAQAQQFKIPDTVRNVKEYAFWGCNDLKDLFLSAGMEEIGDYAFANCQGLETVTVHEPLQRIGMGAFANAKNLRQIHLPISVTNIHSSAFSGCPIDIFFTCPEDSYASQYAQENHYPHGTEDLFLVSYSTSDASDSKENEANDVTSGSGGNVTTSNQQEEMQDGQNPDMIAGNPVGNSVVVSDRVFVMMDDLPVVSGSDSQAVYSQTYEGTISHSNDYAHYQDEALTDLPNLSGALAIGQLAYARSGLQSARIPEGITTIGYGAFYHCDRLETVSIPSTVQYIDAYAFAFTPWLENWEKNGVDDFLIVGDGVLVAYKGTEQEVVVPDNVRYIAANAFHNNTSIVSVTLPLSLIDIGEHAFSGCVNLNTVTPADFVGNAPTTAFEGCNL